MSAHCEETVPLSPNALTARPRLPNPGLDLAKVLPTTLFAPLFATIHDMTPYPYYQYHLANILPRAYSSSPLLPRDSDFLFFSSTPPVSFRVYDGSLGVIVVIGPPHSIRVPRLSFARSPAAPARPPCEKAGNLELVGRCHRGGLTTFRDQSLRLAHTLSLSRTRFSPCTSISTRSDRRSGRRKRHLA